jgi:hypothetical protein
MTAQPPEVTLTRSKQVDEEIRNIYINYMQMMLDAAKDPQLMDKLFNDNDFRVKYLNEKVGMKVPEGTTIIFKTENMRSVQVFIKDEAGVMYIEEGLSNLKVIERLQSGEVEKEKLQLAKATEVDVDVKEAFEECTVVALLPFWDPKSDLILFELKFDDTEIVFTTCILV